MSMTIKFGVKYVFGPCKIGTV